jgi:hypothetical protein
MVGFDVSWMTAKGRLQLLAKCRLLVAYFGHYGAPEESKV